MFWVYMGDETPLHCFKGYTVVALGRLINLEDWVMGNVSRQAKVLGVSYLICYSSLDYMVLAAP